MRDIFVDTSGWGHLIDPRETHHLFASDIYKRTRQQKHRLITTNYVMAELVALLTSPFRIPRITTIKLIDNLKASPYIQVIHIDAELDEKAWQLLRRRVDKEWSLVDCASFVTMQELGISEALTADYHFEQAGFARLLKP